MIKTLRITSIIAAIVAVVLLLLPAVYGVRTDPKIDELLKAPSAAEKFSATRGQAASRDENQSSPLIKQAMDFALYLNPPPPPTPEPPPTPMAVQETKPIVVTPKFELVGVSYYANRPELSYALINEPGKGFSWVKQGSNVEHLIIEEINDGSIIIRDGQKKSEMKVPVQETWRNLLKKPSPETSPTSGVLGIAQPAKPPEVRPGTSAGPLSRNPVRTISDPRSRRTGSIRPGETPQPATAPVAGRNVEPRTIANPPVQATPAVGKEPAKSPVTPAQTPQPAPTASPEPESPENASAPPPPLPTEKDIIHTRLMEEVRASRMTEAEARQIEKAATTLEQLEQIQAQRAEKARADANKPK